MAEVGREIERLDAWRKVLGKALYAADMRLEGLLHMKVLRSDRPHARIRSIDTSRAQGIEGVVRVFTWRDIPGKNLIGIINKDQPVLAAERVRYVGEPIALVVASTEEAASEALEAIRVKYEDLPHLQP